MVVLFHAGLDGVVGGFVGVDLFFVLSGYLVTNVLLTDLQVHGTLRLARFYARRARRLVPAATVAVVVTAAAAVAVIPLLDRERTVGDARASSLWYANWHFLQQSSEYFAIDGPESPFLHFWSLSIEEQFYVAFPLLLLAVWRIRPRLTTILALVSSGFACGLVIQNVLAASDVNRAYLGTDGRVYQILAGALLATVFWRWNLADPVAARPRVRRTVQLASALAFLGFVFVSSAWFDVTVSRRGMAAAAVSLLLVATLELGGPSVVAATLSWRPVRYLGQISYGTYLWHWPVLVLARAVVDMSPLAAACLSGLIGTALAALSSELVEIPVRYSKRLDAVPRRAIALGVALAVVSGLAVAPLLLGWDRQPVVLAQRDAVLVTSGGAPPELDWESIQRDAPDFPPCQDPGGTDCFLHDGSAGTILLIGDSHSRMLIDPMLDVAARLDMALAIDFIGACPWQDGLLSGDSGERLAQRCVARRQLTYGGRVEAIDPDVIVLAGFPHSNDRGDISTTKPELQALSRAELVQSTTDASLRKLAAGGQKVLAVEPLPIMPRDPLSCLSVASDVNECVYQPLAEGIEEMLLRELAIELDTVDTIDLDDRVCPSGDACPPIIQGLIVHRDRQHFTPEFARTLAPELTAAIETLLAAH